MNKIASFTVNHLNLLTGVYVSRRDYIGDVLLLAAAIPRMGKLLDKK